MNWQPIETAPKDGTPVLLFTGEGILEAYYLYGEWNQSACHSTYEGAGGVVISCKPTHWMPLPEAPKL